VETVISLPSYEEHRKILAAHEANLESMSSHDAGYIEAYNSVILHRIYFNCISHPVAPSPSCEVMEALLSMYGSIDEFRTLVMELALREDTRLVMLGYDLVARGLCLVPMNGYSCGTQFVLSVLVLDMFEHAYYMDYGTNAQAYVDAFLASINWEFVDSMYRQCRRVTLQVEL
jgi:Fe-Mn family superoxide dismutase